MYYLAHAQRVERNHVWFLDLRYMPKSDMILFDQVGANGEVDEVNRSGVLPVGALRTSSVR